MDVYQPDSRLEKDKLGVVAGTVARASMLLQQAFAHTKSEANDHTSRSLNRISKLCYDGSKKESPDFTTTFFLTYQKELLGKTKQERIQKVQHNVQQFNMAYAVLKTLHDYDPRLSGRPEVVKDIKEQKKAAAACYIDFDDTELETKDIPDEKRYTKENVQICLKQLSLCHVIIGGEVNLTESAKSIFASFIHKQNERYLEGFSTMMYHMAEPKVKMYPIITGAYQALYTMMCNTKTDPSVPKKNIHPKPMP